MKNRLLSILLIIMSCTLALSVCFGAGCGKSNGNPGNSSNTDISDSDSLDDGSTDDSGDSSDEEKTFVDLVLFIGQSNMAGRGTTNQATVVEEGHAYEFRAISDPTKLYPLTEPFGANENNAESGVSETKKTGSLVSAFCESYYQTTFTPIVAVSCAQGGTGINFWDTNRPAYADACARMLSAKQFISNSDKFTLRNTFIVWLQGETDGDNGVVPERYNKTLAKIFDGFKADIGVNHCFVIPIGGFNGSDENTKLNYEIIRQSQIDFCQSYSGATVISIQLYDMYLYGFMKDNFHYIQEGYEIVGKDAGTNMAAWVNGDVVDCKHYTNSTQLKTGGAWKEKNGKVVIPAAAAFENSVYASVASRYASDGTKYYWNKVNGLFDGAQLLPDNGATWNTGTGFEKSPQLNFTFNVENTGKYYLYLLTSHPDTDGNSVLACMDENTLTECALGSYGTGIWQSSESWAFDITTRGEHTITVCAREDGCVINQIVLSTNKNENFTTKVAEEESDRLPIVKKGAFVEVNGNVCIDLFSAFEQSEFCSYYGGRAANSASDINYYWERSTNGRGVQILPKDTALWRSSTANMSPKLTYKVRFTTPGEYYVYMYASFIDATSDSAMISIDNDTPVELALSFSSSGSHRWSRGDAWKINVKTAGEHTITVYARESGAVMHKIYLSRNALDSVGAKNPEYSPRISIDNQSYTEKNGVLFVETQKNKNEYSLSFENAGNYDIYATANTAGNATINFNGKSIPAAFTSNDGWKKLGVITVEKTGSYNLNINGDLNYLYLINEDNLNVKGVKTLVLGDSYTHKTYWTTFDSQMSEIGSVTIGVSGSTVNDWTGRVREFSLYDPENIVVHIGVNDINRGKTGEQCGNNIVAFLKSIKAAYPDANLFYVNICDNNANSSKWAEYAVSNEIVKNYADNTSGVYCLDFNTAMKKHSMTNNGFVRDNLHPNAEGYVVLSELIIDAVKQVNGEEVL